LIFIVGGQQTASVDYNRVREKMKVVKKIRGRVARLRIYCIY